MERAMNPQPKIVVMGAGGIGGIVAATLTEVGAAVTAVSTNPAIRAAVDASGYRVLDNGEERTVRGSAMAAVLSLRDSSRMRTELERIRSTLTPRA